MKSSTARPDALDLEIVLQRIHQTNSCRNLDPPVAVCIDPEGWHSLLVY